MKWIFFDLDGTLSESKQPLSIETLARLRSMNQKYKVIIVSGAPLTRMIGQVPIEHVTYMAQNGNEIYEHDTILLKNEFEYKNSVMEHIKILADRMQVPINESTLEDRGSQLSFSFVGHNAPAEQKNAFDPDKSKRISLLKEFPCKQAVIGGTTCIDYIPYTKGENIQRYLTMKKFNPFECLYIGDAFMDYGNDATVLGVVPTYKVNNPQETLEVIKKL